MKTLLMKLFACIVTLSFIFMGITAQANPPTSHAPARSPARQNVHHEHTFAKAHHHHGAPKGLHKGVTIGGGPTAK